MRRMLSPRLTAALFSLVAVLGLRADDSARSPQSVPFELLPSKHMAVQVKINGKGPYRLVFDTGAPMMLITMRAAKDAGLVKRDARPLGAGLFSFMGEPTTIKDFEMGGLKAENVATVVMDHPTVKVMEELFGRLDGIVGFPFFARYRMTIDYQAKTMSFEPVDFKPTNIFDSLMNILMADPKTRNAPKVLAPLAQWGLMVDKGTEDDEPGVEVRRVFRNGPAAQSGLREGDRILTVDGRWTDSVIDFYEAAGHVQPGKSVPLKIQRGSETRTIQLTPKRGL
ncbi:MAG: aspartyl protease family protein [Gemmataceae bacterium]|nr:aspartyl protease family protein [Gemmataceae bacterium]